MSEDIRIGSIVKINPLSTHKRKTYIREMRPFAGEKVIDRIATNCSVPLRIGEYGYHRDELLVKGVDYT